MMEATHDINHNSPTLMLNIILFFVAFITGWMGISWKHLHEILSVVLVVLSIISVSIVIIINVDKAIKKVKGWFKQ